MSSSKIRSRGCGVEKVVFHFTKNFLNSMQMKDMVVSSYLQNSVLECLLPSYLNSSVLDSFTCLCSASFTGLITAVIIINCCCFAKYCPSSSNFLTPVQISAFDLVFGVAEPRN